MKQWRKKNNDKDGERQAGGNGEGAGTGMTCMNSKASRGKGGFAIHFEACSTSVSVM